MSTIFCSLYNSTRLYHNRNAWAVSLFIYPVYYNRLVQLGGWLL